MGSALEVKEHPTAATYPTVHAYLTAKHLSIVNTVTWC